MNGIEAQNPNVNSFPTFGNKSARSESLEKSLRMSQFIFYKYSSNTSGSQQQDSLLVTTSGP